MGFGVPITGGSPSGDVAVVALAHGDALQCSATVIAPHAVLTAAHCLTGAQLPDIAIGATLAGAVRHAALAGFVHPDFDAATLDHDLAVIIVEPLGIATIPIATVLGASPGATIRVVGFGWTVAGDSSPPERRSGTSMIDAIEPLRIVSSAAPAQTCEGDSGGPALYGAEVIGVASSGDPACTQVARHTRVDVHADFVLYGVARSAEGAAGPGDRCWYDTNCRDGACVPARDEPRWSFCAPACASGNCPGALECVTIAGEPRCVNRLPSPGAEGASCAGNGDCAGGLCLAPRGEPQTVCATRCFFDLPSITCPSGETCRSASDGEEACFADDNGGCRATRGNGLAACLLSLALALAHSLRGRGRP